MKPSTRVIARAQREVSTETPCCAYRPSVSRQVPTYYMQQPQPRATDRYPCRCLPIICKLQQPMPGTTDRSRPSLGDVGQKSGLRCQRSPTRRLRRCSMHIEAYNVLRRSGRERALSTTCSAQLAARSVKPCLTYLPAPSKPLLHSRWTLHCMAAAGGL